MIDGHNLIAHIPGLSLGMLDDEQQLIELLNRFGEIQRGRLEVFFDRAPLGFAGARSFGRVRAHFVVQSSTADEAIRVRLARLGKSAASWKVVSSDRSVQAAAREVHAGVIKSEDFARLLLPSVQENPGSKPQSSEKPLSAQEVDEWLKLFKQRKSTH